MHIGWAVAIALGEIGLFIALSVWLSRRRQHRLMRQEVIRFHAPDMTFFFVGELVWFFGVLAFARWGVMEAREEAGSWLLALEAERTGAVGT